MALCLSSFLEYFGQRNTTKRKFNSTQMDLFKAFENYNRALDEGDLNREEYRDIVHLFDSLWDYSE